MAYDRFVNWKGKKPTRKEIRYVLEDYFASAAMRIEWKRDRFFVDLVGNHTHPLRRMKDVPDYVKLPPEPGWDGRNIEVIVMRDCLDVLTRRQDEFTNCVADGLARLFARFWEGDLEG